MEKEKRFGKRTGCSYKLFIADETIGLGKIDLLERLGEAGSIRCCGSPNGDELQTSMVSS